MTDIPVGEEPTDIKRVEMHRIAGDIYLAGQKVVFAVDFGKSVEPEYAHVDWLLGWAKIGLMSKGYTVPYFPSADIKSFKEKEPGDVVVR